MEEDGLENGSGGVSEEADVPWGFSKSSTQRSLGLYNFVNNTVIPEVRFITLSMVMQHKALSFKLKLNCQNSWDEKYQHS